MILSVTHVVTLKNDSWTPLPQKLGAVTVAESQEKYYLLQTFLMTIETLVIQTRLNDGLKIDRRR